jgi:flagellin
MALSVLNNIASLAAQNQLTITNGNLQKALFQLSSGSRINTGADDAAGLAIADGLHANITALTQSARNANDGVGELQVADGSLAAVTTLLNRAITIATEAATGTVSDPQRIALDAEYTAIKSEIDRVGQKTNYNGGQVFTANTLNVFLSDGGAASNSLIGVSTGVLSSNGLGLGGPVSATATLSQTAGTPAVAATATLTGGTIVGEAAASVVYTGGAFTAAVAASGTLTSSGVAANNDTVLVGTQTYTFKTVLTGGGATANEVLIGANAAASLQNLKDAINLTGVAGTAYGSATTINASATAGAITATTLVVTAKLNGTAGNALASVGNGGTFTFGAATLAGGVAGDTVTVGSKTYTFVTAFSNTATANEVISSSEATGLANLAAATNAAAGSGTTYSASTTINANVSAGTSTGTTLTFTALTKGTGGNAIASTETGAGSFASATLTGGVAGSTVTVGAQTYKFVAALSGAANEVLVGSLAVSLTNLSAAVNGAAGAGTQYGTGTATNSSATAIGGATTIAFTAITPGLAGNAIVSTVTNGTGGAGNTFGGATFSGGAAAVAAPSAAAGDTVTVGTQTYTFVTNLSSTPTANEVVVGNSELVSLANLAAAVNGGGGSGATYGSPTVANTLARATASATSVVFTALTGGVNGNTIASTETGAANTFTGATFAGGTVGSANDLLNITDATAALATINTSIQTVAALRGTIGATVNRLQSAAGVINNQVQNLTGAEDGVRAADVPSTIATLAKFSILEQTGISALAQANQQQQLVLKLLQ